MATLAVDPYAEVKERLKEDLAFYAANFCQIVDRQKIVPLVFRPAQQRFWEALSAQRDRGEPMRAIVLKARKIGFSTATQALMLQRVTQRPNHNALTIAHRIDTAEALMAMFELMYEKLPEHPELAFLKPEIANRRKRSEMIFGEKARNQLQRGAIGLNSRVKIDTAKEFEAGRGDTYHSVHMSEAAFWPDIKRKMTSIINAIPQDDPDTLVVIESTANGYNEFREWWVRSLDGQSDFIPFFSPWHEDARYSRSFGSGEEREAFLEGVGSGPWGEDEPMLVEQFGLSAEQLKWRRWAIENLAGSDLQQFQQEYPATWEEAFATTGKHVFAPLLVKRVRTETEDTEAQAERLVLKTTKTVSRRGRYVQIDVPTAFKVDAAPENARNDLFWRVWERPEEKGQYLIVADPASEEEATDGLPDWTAVQIVNHRTRRQCAELQTRAEKDLVAEQVFLACLWYSVRPHRPLLVVEMTGGYGDFLLSRVYKEYGYKRPYKRLPTDPRRREPDSELLGFSTNRNTKPRLVDEMRELLRERSHGIRSERLANELGTYQRVKRGYGAAPGSFDDLLTAYMIGQLVASEVPVRPDRSPGQVVSTAVRAVRNPKLGY